MMFTERNNPLPEINPNEAQKWIKQPNSEEERRIPRTELPLLETLTAEEIVQVNSEREAFKETNLGQFLNHLANRRTENSEADKNAFKLLESRLILLENRDELDKRILTNTEKTVVEGYIYKILVGEVQPKEQAEIIYDFLTKLSKDIPK